MMTRVGPDTSIVELCDSRPTIPTLDEVVAVAESLAPDDRLRLIARLWESMPAEHWAAPSPNELIEIKRRLGDFSTVAATIIPSGFIERVRAFCAPGGPALYSAPRRFDLATIFVVTAAYSLLFTGLTLLDFHPLEMLVIGAFITVIGVGQALLIKVLNPRAASIVVGAAFSICIGIVWWTYEDDPLWLLMIIVVVYGLFAGGVFGYIAGVLVGGVFLVADALRHKFKRHIGTVSDEASEPD
jgi:hypothetical protein